MVSEIHVVSCFKYPRIYPTTDKNQLLVLLIHEGLLAMHYNAILYFIHRIVMSIL